MFRVLCLLVVLALLPALAEACPTCKEGLAENDVAGQAAARGFAYSIMFMISMPFLIFGSFSSYIFFQVRKANRDQKQEE